MNLVGIRSNVVASVKYLGRYVQYIPRNIHTVTALLCFVVVIHWLIFPYPSGLFLWHCGNLTIAPVPAKQPWWIWINTSCEFIMNDCITTTKQSTTKPCAYFLGYTVCATRGHNTFRTMCIILGIQSTFFYDFHNQLTLILMNICLTLKCVAIPFWSVCFSWIAREHPLTRH